MAYRDSKREQMAMLPPVIDDYVGPEDPVRAYDAIIEAMDMKEMGLVIDSKKVGNPAYDPKAMLKLLVYGYSYGWRSSRKMERALHHNLSFIWLMGGLKPDHKTIANFRKNNWEALQCVLKLCARICLKLDLIAGNCLFTDGTKIRGDASIDETRTREGWERKLAWVDERIEAIMIESEAIDESETGSLIRVSTELADAQKMKQKIERTIEQMKEAGLTKGNGTDMDCVNFKSRQGSHAGYNAQITVDEKHGLIINADVVSESSDRKQFANQVNQALEVLGQPCQTAVADAGYSNVENIQEITDKGIDVIVPTQRQALHEPEDQPFSKDKFRYDAQNNHYVCPQGHILKYSHYSTRKGHHIYRIGKASLCLTCLHYGICTDAKRGRTLIR